MVIAQQIYNIIPLLKKENVHGPTLSNIFTNTFIILLIYFITFLLSLTFHIIFLQLEYNEMLRKVFSLP